MNLLDVLVRLEFDIEYNRVNLQRVQPLYCLRTDHHKRVLKNNNITVIYNK